MFQSYDNPSQKEKGPERLKLLREKMAKGNLDAWLLPHGDEHRNEYTPERAQRLAWVTGFTGSAGFLIVTQKQAILFVDGRYTLQAADQVDKAHFEIESLEKLPPAKWLEQHGGELKRVGVDLWCISTDEKKRFEKALSAAGDSGAGAILAASNNLVDAVWHDQPCPPQGMVRLHEDRLAGKPAFEKIAEISATLAESGSQRADLCVLTDPSSICWLFNIRGSDVAHNPVTLAWAILRANDRPLLFIDERKLSLEVKAYLTQLADLEAQGQLAKRLQQLAAGKKVLLDPALAAAALGDLVTEAGGKVVHGKDPVILPRAIKNKAELAGARSAQLRDGVAMVRFLYWLDKTSATGTSEIGAAKRLEEFRLETAAAMGSELKEISFDTISGFGPNGAIVHYRVNEDSNLAFSSDALYLVDSGGQYEDGTTDITRTVAIGTPPKEAITDFTLVLKGHIAIATARFPTGTRGVDIDVLARHALWQQGKDYGHGTGHGVGACLAVHEGPQSISRRGMEELKPGMILSNEPGYYREGQYGIRIENLVIVNEPQEIAGGNTRMMDFETITLCPIDLRLIDASLMSEAEIAWLNSYHERVFEALSPHLEAQEAEWLKGVTEKI